MGFNVVDMEEFIEWRWRTYQNALKNKDQIARDYGCPVECVVIGEPPVNGEVRCDICCRNIDGPNVILNEEGDYVYCQKCAEEPQ